MKASSLSGTLLATLMILLSVVANVEWSTRGREQRRVDVGYARSPEPVHVAEPVVASAPPPVVPSTPRVLEPVAPVAPARPRKAAPRRPAAAPKAVERVIDASARRAFPVDPPRVEQPAAPADVAAAPAPRNASPALGIPPLEIPVQRGESVPVVWSDRVGYPVTRFAGRYAEGAGDAPDLDELFGLRVRLGRTNSGYVEPGQGELDVEFALSQIPGGHPKVFYAGALRSINAQLAAELNRRGLLGVFVAPDELDIDSVSAQDLRAPGHSELRLLVTLSRVRELRSVGAGERVASSERINNAAHERVRRQSPVQPDGGATATDLVRSDLLDDYLFRVNRHPGRRVDVSLAPSDQPGGVAVDYLISESRPWTAFAQYANTGSATTGAWRQSFGFANYQLTGRDDILSLNYVTSGFDTLNSFSGSYDAPWFDSQHLRWRVDGLLGSFHAADVGFANADFSSTTKQLGAGLSYNVFQHRELFVDLVGGLHWQQLETEHKLIGQQGLGTFLLPQAGLSLERRTPFSNLRASALFEKSLAQSGLAEIGQLGRTFPDADWLLMRWDTGFSFYLEPLLAPLWSGVTPTSALAHELSVGFRGQHAFGSRLVPQQQMVAGGFQSVRGYPEGSTAGDSVAIGQAQYNLHVPRLLPSRAAPARIPLLGDFRFAPQQAHGQADWDLTLHAFVDAARVQQSDRLPFESDRFMAGTGIGAELALKRYLALRFDYGIALRPIDGLVEPGDSRIHAGFTVRY